MGLSGIVTAMVTPFDDKEKIHFAATEQLIEFLIAKGAAALFILGTNGEFHMLTSEEKVAFAQYVVSVVKQRVPVIIGVGGNSTREVLFLAKEMSQLGADYLSVIAPYFNKLTENELYQHYQTIARHTSVPVLLYNIPKMTGNPLTVDLVGRLADEANIVGIKDSSGDIDTIKGYLEVSKDKDFFVLSGSDSLILKALKLGAAGAVAATSNAIIENDVRIYSEFIAGDMQAAQEAQDSIEEFRCILKYGTIPSVLKQAVALRGIPVGEPRKPVQPVDRRYMDDIQQVMHDYIKKAEEEDAKS